MTGVQTCALPILIGDERSAVVPVRIGLLIDPFSRSRRDERGPDIDEHSGVPQVSVELIRARHVADPHEGRWHLVRIEHMLVRGNQEQVSDVSRAQPPIGPVERAPPVRERLRRERVFRHVVLDRFVIGVEEPPVAALDDRRARRGAEDEELRLAVPSDEGGPKPEVIVEPRAEVGAGEGGELAVLAFRIPAVAAGDVQGGRQRDQQDEKNDEWGSPQNRK